MKCCILGCTTNNNISNYTKFFTFPTNYARRKKWMEALKLNSEPPLGFLVCSLHFSESDLKLDKSTLVPTTTNQTSQSGIFQIKPSTFYDYQKQNALKFNLQQLQHCHNGISKSQSHYTGKRKPESAADYTYKKQKPDDISEHNKSIIPDIPFQYFPNNNVGDTNINEFIPIINMDDYPDYDDQMAIESDKFDSIESVPTIRNFPEINSKSTQTDCAVQGILSRYLTYSQHQIEYYTGLKPNRFELLIHLIGREKIKLTYDDIGLHDQLLLTLFRYRHNCDFKLMQYIFKVKLEYLLTIFKECSNALYTALSKINYMSTSKKNDGNSVVVDSTNFLVESTDNENHMKLLISADDQQPKFKLLLGCDENGLIVFISDTYGNAMPCRELFLKAEFPTKILKYEEIILCKDFKADDILKSNNIKYKTVTKKDEYFLNQEIDAMGAMEDLINNIKQYKILSDPIPVIFWPFVNKIIKNCFYLNNLQNKSLNTIVMLK